MMISTFTDEEQREIREHAQEKFREVLMRRVELVSHTGPGICRLRIAFTDLEKSAALANIHPLTRATGEFFEGSGMGDLADIKSTIDRSSVDAEERFDSYW